MSTCFFFSLLSLLLLFFIFIFCFFCLRRIALIAKLMGYASCVFIIIVIIIIIILMERKVAMGTIGRFYVGPAASFKEKSRQLVKCDKRNIAVYRYKDRFYALDNACYHHGGSLLEGDIEEMGSHPCVVCPWHEYRITLDTGEGLYWALQMTPEGVPDRHAPQKVCSKGLKQRTHIVTVEDGDVFVTLNISGPRLASDNYAEMVIANMQGAMISPLEDSRRTHRSVNGLGVGIHSGVRSGHVFSGIGMGNRLQLFNHLNFPSLTCVAVEPVCDDTQEYYFRLSEGEIDTTSLVPGQFVDLELPIAAPPGRRFVRRWTVVEVNKGGCVFTLIIKTAEHSNGGTAWMSSNALHQRFSLVHYGGSFTLTHHMSRLREVRGRVVMLSAGIAMTAPYSSLRQEFEGKRMQGIPKLHIIHLHVERQVSCVAKLEDFVRWHHSKAEHLEYHFHCYLTKQQELSANLAGDKSLRSLFTCGRRPNEEDIQSFVGDLLGPSSPVLAMVCGPPAFVRMAKEVLLACGVLPSDVLTDEDDDYNHL
ncbi:hypothetical protein MOQ_005098 [Trypanosoma cruzi marinkellei]|uniref:Rieske domain-containing protein n=1 Tax=Trypanosoma cruzi marinkellei TaxID=85056 RepID=K2M7S3_TRYCR|nr:hypothetical protein MOQ_005098 [Trypanosoma cruzi marinkellei]